jgi:hypothetical protein
MADVQGWWANLGYRAKIILISTVLGLLYFTFVNSIQAAGIPAFILLTLPVYIGFALLIGFARPGGLLALLGTISLLAAFDLLTPPYAVNFSGQLVGTSPAAIDSALYTLWAGFNVQANSLMWGLVYPIAFVVLIAIGVNLVTRTRKE